MIYLKKKAEAAKKNLQSLNSGIDIKSIPRKIDNKFEIIFINDGSTDNTLKKLKLLRKKDKKIKILSNNVNQGKSFSLISGI